MFILSLIAALFFLATPARAQIPLYYQLLEAFHPQTIVADNHPVSLGTPSATATGTPLPSPPADTKTVTIGILGDSMIDTLGPGVPSLLKSLQKYYPGRNFNVLNYGYSSTDIEYGLYRLEHDYDYQGRHVPSLLSQEPDVIIVESFAYNNFGNTQSGFDRQWLNLGAITSTIKNNLPGTKIVLASTITPNSVIFANGVKDLHLSSLDKIEKTSTIKLYLQNLINFATSEHYPLADAYHPSMFNDDGLTELINSTDNIHPSTAGAELFSDVIAKTLHDEKVIE
jgi:lysophospholipase L1-like esterase